ncbi:hypothetical protein K474DRAFT_1594948 [Panus rudis PR-1116 ss-1]|nr:hypothetical protein K474DRAFT_1594948 [Panus rudis PR-1116 ss-1]
MKKKRDYKEDIDTLLVFGGLFSAVMTAFLIESYKNLQGDPDEALQRVLLHISMQLGSFTVGQGFANSTIPLIPPASHFKPPLIARRVNVMWFASLIIALMAASYGMLIKQWLREYLAGEETSPQARVRIRCFRFPALQTWKVFEIVAILPLLLQLSLGLFLLGLCFFTSSIHPSIGFTCIPLVALWITLLFSSTMAPILGPRCPYKTTFLKNAII